MQTLKEIRLSKAMRLRELAEKIGASEGHLSYIERGVKRATPWLLKEIAEALGVDFDFIKLIHEQQVAENAKTPD